MSGRDGSKMLWGLKETNKSFENTLNSATKIKLPETISGS
jgi:hypothetical protein